MAEVAVVVAVAVGPVVAVEVPEAEEAEGREAGAEQLVAGSPNRRSTLPGPKL